MVGSLLGRIFLSGRKIANFWLLGVGEPPASSPPSRENPVYIYNIYTIYICIYVYMYICMYIYMYIHKVVTTISINLSIYLSSLRYIVRDHEITQAMQFAETSF